MPRWAGKRVGVSAEASFTQLYVNESSFHFKHCQDIIIAVLRKSSATTTTTTTTRVTKRCASSSVSLKKLVIL